MVKKKKSFVFLPLSSNNDNSPLDDGKGLCGGDDVGGVRERGLIGDLREKLQQVRKKKKKNIIFFYFIWFDNQ